MKFRLIVSSDTHGSVMPVQYSNNKPANHGFLKMLSTVENYVDDRTLVIDNGDTIEGSPFTTYCMENMKDDSPISDCLNGFYNYINIGNHDFNYGQEMLLNYINHFNGVCICGNVKYNGKRLGEEYVVHTFNDNKKIALIGCVTQYLVNFEKECNLVGIEIEDCYEYCRRTIASIKSKENVEAVVIVYHGGFEKDFDGNDTELQTGENEGYKICSELDFDILVSGHQHLSIAGKCCGKLVSQTNKDAKEFALIDYDTELRDGKVELIKSDCEVNAKYIGRLDKIEKCVQNWLDKPLGCVNNCDLEIKNGFDARLHKHPLISFLNDVQFNLSGADLSGSALFNDAVGFKKEITMRDLVSTYVYPNSLMVLEIDGKTLKKYLEKNAEYFVIEDNKIAVNPSYYMLKQKHYNYDMVDGVDYTIKVSNEIGNRIIDLKYKGNDVKDDDLFSIAVNNYRYGGGGGFEFMNTLKILRVYEQDMVATIVEYIKKNNGVTVSHRDNIKVII